MVGFDQQLRYIRGKRTLLIRLLLLNIVLTAVVLVWMRSQRQYRAQVKVVFNEVKLNFEGNQAKAYLFDAPKRKANHYAFINILQMDSLVGVTVRNFALADHYGLDPAAPDRDKQAAEALRRNVWFNTEEAIEDPALTLTLSDGDEAMAEALLLDLVGQVARVHQAQARSNNAVTRQIADRYRQDINQKLPEIHAEIQRIPDNPPKLAAPHELGESLEKYYRGQLKERFELEDLIRKLDAEGSHPLYRPYSVINQGVQVAAYNPVVLAVLVLVANLMALVVEMQLVFFFNFLRGRDVLLEMATKAAPESNQTGKMS
ncbi:MAG: hypothetical protein AAGB22_03380 [Bacteroidota bacterium]